ncbi:hypothetical protein ACFFQF_31670 [Haladaptatus pallidirubidus]|uniref:Uncharacterized protein n=1 Tax=Haladaptatus pallidirubidus TaxID=1008152 RepID=A0AAV3UPS7_9EURY|nr:hypothetical protein [Haladaptatus pallidirubidus]
MLKTTGTVGVAGVSALTADAASAVSDTSGTCLDADVTTVAKPTRIREYPTYDVNGERTWSRGNRVRRL